MCCSCSSLCKIQKHGKLYGAEELKELQKKEKEMNVQPDWEIDAFTKAQIRTGKRHSIVTDLILKLLGLDVGLPAPHPPPPLRFVDFKTLCVCCGQRMAIDTALARVCDVKTPANNDENFAGSPDCMGPPFLHEYCDIN